MCFIVVKKWNWWWASSFFPNNNCLKNIIHYTLRILSLILQKRLKSIPKRISFNKINCFIIINYFFISYFWKLSYNPFQKFIDITYPYIKYIKERIYRMKIQSGRSRKQRYLAVKSYVACLILMHFVSNTSKFYYAFKIFIL